ncbi:MAG: hypothetical protein CMJ18_11020 [Phycisphaeraceae bacterium]|nr:hypothetical protein [Phycisphaeraceae bacterium]
MTRRRRRPPERGEYEDPLSRYEAPTYRDELERAMCEEPVTAVQTRPAPTISADATVREAMQLLDDLDIACLLVTRDDRLAGVFTERDVLQRVAGRFGEVGDLPVEAFMTTDPIVVYETDDVATATCVMATNGLRHVPVLDVEGAVLGIVSPRRLTEFLQAHFEQIQA